MWHPYSQDVLCIPICEKTDPSLSICPLQGVNVEPKSVVVLGTEELPNCSFKNDNITVSEVAVTPQC